MKLEKDYQPSFFSGDLLDLGDVSGTVSISYEEASLVKINLIGDAELVITHDVSLPNLEDAKLLVTGTDTYSYSLRTSNGAILAEDVGGIWALGKVKQNLGLQYLGYRATLTSPALLDGDLYCLSVDQSVSISERGLVRITFPSGYDEDYTDVSLVYDAYPQETDPKSMHISDDGLYFMVTGTDGDGIYLYTNTVPFDFTTASFQGYSGDLGAGSYVLYGVYMKPDGTSVFGLDNSRVTREWTLSTPYDITTISASSVQAVSQATLLGSEYSAQGRLQFRDNGSTLIMSEREGILVIELSTPYDLSTVSSRKYINFREHAESLGILGMTDSWYLSEGLDAHVTDDNVALFFYAVDFFGIIEKTNSKMHSLNITPGGAELKATTDIRV